MHAVCEEEVIRALSQLCCQEDSQASALKPKHFCSFFTEIVSYVESHTGNSFRITL